MDSTKIAKMAKEYCKGLGSQITPHELAAFVMQVMEYVELTNPKDGNTAPDGCKHDCPVKELCEYDNVCHTKHINSTEAQ